MSRERDLTRISVALCVYNGERYLGEQLASIAGQNRLPDELVVSDDGSSDGSAELIEQFATKVDFPVRLVRNRENLGIAKNFEQAIGLCEGDLIVTADQDDVWYPHKLARIESAFRDSPEVGLVFSDADLIDGEGKLLGARLWESVRFNRRGLRRLARNDPFRELLRRPIITGATMAFRSKLRGLVLPISPSWVHDEWIGLMVAAVSQIEPIDEPLMQYRRHENNQVGVIGLGVAERAKATLIRPRVELLALADRFEEFRDAMANRVVDRPELLTALDQKIAHVRERGSLPDSRIRRIPRILRELTSFRYARYSGHALSFAKDFLSRS